MNKKGSMADLIVWIVIGFITVLFLGAWMYGHNLLTNQLVTVGVTSSGTNISEAAEQTFGAVNASMGALKIWALVILISMAIAILISSFLVKAHPVFYGVYFLVILVSIIFSIYVSNSYETLMQQDTLGATLSSFRGASWIMLHLPIWTCVIGLFGAILLFSGIPRDSGLGGGVV